MPDETTRTEIMGEPGILRVEMRQRGLSLTAELVEAAAPFMEFPKSGTTISTLYNHSREVLLPHSLHLNPHTMSSNGANRQGYPTEADAACALDQFRAAIAHYCAEWKRQNGATSEQSAAPQTDNPSAESDGAFAIRMWKMLAARVIIHRAGGSTIELDPGRGASTADAIRLATIIGAPHA